MVIGALLALAPRSPAQNNAKNSIATRRFSALEQERIRRALERQGGKLEEHPEGKRIESIEIVALEVFEPQDPVPQFLNWFHPTTKRYVIERELLMRVGSRFDQSLSDETERNLRALGLFSVVLAIPLQGSSESSVRYLVVTKDIWSLRLGWDGQINDGVLDYLAVTPTEANLLGTGRRVFGSAAFYRRIYTLGVGFVEPRLGGAHISLNGRVDATFNCATGKVEGSSGSFSYARPLYSTRTRWSYGTSLSWSNGRSPFVLATDQLGSICSVTAPDEAIVAVPNRSGNGAPDKLAYYPNQYLFDTQNFQQYITRSYGIRFKNNLTFGLEATRSASRGVDLSNIRAAESENPEELTPSEVRRVEDYYQRLLPQGNRRISPYFQLASFTTDYQSDLNADTLALQETFRLGHVATLKVYPALKAAGSSRDLIGVSTGLSYALAVGTGYLKASASQLVELSKLNQTDAWLSLGLHFNSPRMIPGRFVYDVQLVDAYRNFRTGRLGLGGTGRLRGYISTAAAGTNLFVSNLEFRSRPLQLWSAQLAGVLFHDMGDAFDRVGDFNLLHGVGFGLRFLLPELDTDVFRIDVGFPVPANSPGGKVSVIAKFGQAFSTF